MWRRYLSKGLCRWIKNRKIIMSHFSKPDAPFVVDNRSHHSTVGLRKRVLTKRTCTRDTWYRVGLDTCGGGVSNIISFCFGGGSCICTDGPKKNKKGLKSGKK